MDTVRGDDAALDMARIRQGCFRMCATGFAAPSDQRVEELEAGLVALEDLGVGAVPVAGYLRDWVGSLLEASTAALAVEHVRLFGSGMDASLCPPIESQHLGQNLQGDPARYAGRIEDLMRRSGLEARNSDRPPDHIIVELEVASALCGAEARAYEAGESATRWLELEAELAAILEGWVPDLAAVVADRDRIGVFAELCAATEAIVRHDHDFVRLLLSAGEDAGS